MFKKTTCIALLFAVPMLGFAHIGEPAHAVQMATTALETIHGDRSGDTVEATDTNRPHVPTMMETDSVTRTPGQHVGDEELIAHHRTEDTGTRSVTHGPVQHAETAGTIITAKTSGTETESATPDPRQQGTGDAVVIEGRLLDSGTNVGTPAVTSNKQPGWRTANDDNVGGPAIRSNGFPQ